MNNMSSFKIVPRTFYNYHYDCNETVYDICKKVTMKKNGKIVSVWKSIIHKDCNYFTTYEKAQDYILECVYGF